MYQKDMSDREIECLVWMAGDSEPRQYIKHGKSLVLVEECGREVIQDVPRYCNNPSDAWPIIVENMIEVSPPVNPEKNMDWFASDTFKDGALCRDKNPLRAAMICFLKMKDAEK